MYRLLTAAAVAAAMLLSGCATPTTQTGTPAYAPAPAASVEAFVGKVSKESMMELAGRLDYGDTLVVDTPGGSVVAGLAMGDVIREYDIKVVVPADAECSSICTMWLLSARRASVSPDAYIGVHAPSGPPETKQLVYLTLVQWAAKHGYDRRVIDLMYTTPNESIRWVTTGELYYYFGFS